MTQIRKTILVLLVSCLCLTIVQGQSTIPSTGGNANGGGGSVSYTVGQITYQTQSGSNGTVAQGVQQPYEISVVTAIENTEGIILEYKIYPNPTSGSLKLLIKPYDDENFRYRLFDINGLLFLDKKINSGETEIPMESYIPATYFLRILLNNQEVKVFKIIKN